MTLEGKKIEDKTIDRLMDNFVQNLDVEDILAKCLGKELITDDDLARIGATIKRGENSAAVRDLMLHVKRSPPGYLDTFYEILLDSKSKFLAPYVKEEYTKQLEAKRRPVPSIFTNASTATDNHPPNRSNQPLVMPSLDTIKDNPSLVGDGNWPFEKAKPVENESHEVLEPPTEDLTDARGLPSYQMKSSPRGLGIIVNNKIFTCGMKNREGTDRDATALQRLFTHLGFHTNRYDNLTGTQFRRIFNEAAAIDHKKFDCLLVAILTHGIKGKLYGTDGELIPVEDITKLFDGYRCPSLIGKPKIFLLQACRGGNFDYGVEHDMTDGDDDKGIDYAKAIEEQFDSIKARTFTEEVEETDSGYTGTIPAEADYLLAYATIPGYVSWRNNENGSWFVSALVNVFLEMGDREHLMDMLIEVNRRVAEEFESRSGKNKQVPEPVSRLRKRLYFRPGKYS